MFAIMGVPAYRPSEKLTTQGGHAQALAVFVWFGLFIWGFFACLIVVGFISFLVFCCLFLNVSFI